MSRYNLIVTGEPTDSGAGTAEDRGRSIGILGLMDTGPLDTLSLSTLTLVDFVSTRGKNRRKTHTQNVKLVSQGRGFLVIYDQMAMRHWDWADLAAAQVEKGHA